MDGGQYRNRKSTRPAFNGDAGFVCFTKCPPPREVYTMNQENLIERLMAENEEFRRLRSEHQGYEHELAALGDHASLSADQHWRISELKKLKLMAKDRMEAIIRSTRSGVTA
jgi:uncharacterized protein YdcH (DUF465 family)